MTTNSPAAHRLVPLPVANFKRTEFDNTDWTCYVPPTTTHEDLGTSDFLAVVSPKLKRFDRLRFIAENSSFYAEYVVIECGLGYAQVQEIFFIPLQPIVADASGVPPGFDISFAGPEHKYQARRLKDGVVIVDGAGSKEDCLRALLDHASVRQAKQ